MMRITFLSPRLPPAVCGLADHTDLLARALVEKGAEVSFIYYRAQQTEAPAACGSIAAWDGTPAHLGRCVEASKPDWLWLQLSGYGFSRWGAPYVLGSALKSLKQADPKLRVATYAHELYCEPHQLGWKGPLLSPWQRTTIARILRRSDKVFVST